MGGGEKKREPHWGSIGARIGYRFWEKIVNGDKIILIKRIDNETDTVFKERYCVKERSRLKMKVIQLNFEKRHEKTYHVQMNKKIYR